MILMFLLFFTVNLCGGECAQIIYLNGPSSAGKSTLSRALQQELDKPFLHIGIDRVIGMMPEKINNWEGGEAPEGFSWKRMSNGTYEIQIGPFARKIIDTYRELVLTLVKNGHYVIIDDVAFGKDDVAKWRCALKDYNVLWVGIKVPLSVLEERERARGDRLIGQTRGQYDKVHEDVVYDLEFDTSKEPLDKIVQTIRERMCSN